MQCFGFSDGIMVALVVRWLRTDCALQEKQEVTLLGRVRETKGHMYFLTWGKMASHILSMSTFYNMQEKKFKIEWNFTLLYVFKYHSTLKLRIISSSFEVIC